MTSSLPRFRTTDLLKMPTGVHLDLSFTRIHIHAQTQTHTHGKPFDTHMCTNTFVSISGTFFCLSMQCVRRASAKGLKHFSFVSTLLEYFWMMMDKDIKFFCRICHLSLFNIKTNQNNDAIIF